MDSDTYSKDGKQSDSDKALNGSKFENEQLDSLADEEISSKKITEDSSDSNNASGIDETISFLISSTGNAINNYYTTDC